MNPVAARPVAPSTHSGVNYRPDIDGLRAVAVSLVVLFHAFPSLLPGGFVGVDIFFVISGYLIGSILLTEFAAGSFTYRAFYARRIRRIFPALLLVLVACYAFGWFELLADEFKQLGAQVAGGAGFVSNIVLWKGAGYFATQAGKQPLLHLWSLGVEEQFYIILPIAFWIAFKFRRGPVIAISLLWIASFVANIMSVQQHPVAAFYLPSSRFWELMTGCALAWLQNVKRLEIGRWANALSVAGAGMIAIAVVLINEKSIFPGWWALLPVLGATLLIAAGPRAAVNRALLSRQVMVQVGLVSYPLYLWHWPLLAFGRILDAATPSAAFRLAAVAASIVLAFLTTYLVEKPIRVSIRRPRWAITTLCVVMLCMGLAGANTYRRDGMAFRLTSMAGRFTSTDFDVKTAWRENVCFRDGDDKPQFPDACRGGGPGPLVLLWGDSFAASLYPGIESLQRQYVFRLAQYTASGCPPLLPADARLPRCAAMHENSLEEIRHLKPDLVVLQANWSQDDLEKMPNTIAALRSAGVRKIVMVGAVPHWHDKLPNVYWTYWRKSGHQTLPSRSTFDLDESFATIDAAVAAVAAAQQVGFADSYRALCDARGCKTRIGEGKGEIVAFDDAHLTPAGATQLVAQVADQLGIPGIAARR